MGKHRGNPYHDSRGRFTTAGGGCKTISVDLKNNGETETAYTKAVESSPDTETVICRYIVDGKEVKNVTKPKVDEQLKKNIVEFTNCKEVKEIYSDDGITCSIETDEGYINDVPYISDLHDLADTCALDLYEGEGINSEETVRRLRNDPFDNDPEDFYGDIVTINEGEADEWIEKYHKDDSPEMKKAISDYCNNIVNKQIEQYNEIEDIVDEARESARDLAETEAELNRWLNSQ